MMVLASCRCEEEVCKCVEQAERTRREREEEEIEDKSKQPEESCFITQACEDAKEQREKKQPTRGAEWSEK